MEPLEGHSVPGNDQATAGRGGTMAMKSILEQIESGERARLILAASEQPTEAFGFRGSDECRSLLAGAMHETRRDPNAQIFLKLNRIACNEATSCLCDGYEIRKWPS